MKNVIIVFVIFCAGCGKVDNPITIDRSVKVDSPVINFNVQGQLIPFKLHNSWTYIDSTISKNTIDVYEYTESVDSFLIYKNDTIWALTNHDKYNSWYPTNYYRISNDSIFWIGYEEGGRYESLEYLLPMNSDTVFYKTIFGGVAYTTQRAVKLKTGFPTMHGMIDGCVIIGLSLDRYT
ncbi:MAG: hypothetical protein M0R68_15780, partial [Bacteroidetes bacterium]|nr:hypothetical protein [Bacteroidota bacterium]